MEARTLIRVPIDGRQRGCNGESAHRRTHSVRAGSELRVAQGQGQPRSDRARDAREETSRQSDHQLSRPLQRDLFA